MQMRCAISVLLSLLLIPCILFASDIQSVMSHDITTDIKARMLDDGSMTVEWYTPDLSRDFTILVRNTKTGEETEIAAGRVKSYTISGLDVNATYEVVVVADGASAGATRTPLERISYIPPRVTNAPAPLNAPALDLHQEITGLDLTLWPRINLSSIVEDLDLGEYIGGLGSTSFWEVREDGAVVTDCFEVQEIAGFALVDMVFLIDYSGSMDDEIDEVIANVEAFVDDLVASGWDVRLGFVRFGYCDNDVDPPTVFNDGNLTDDVELFKDWLVYDWSCLWNGWWEEGLLAVERGCGMMNFRPGSQRHFLLITDEDSDGGSLVDACDCCNNNNITVHVAVDSYDGTEDYIDGIAACTGGLVFDVVGPYDAILDEIAERVESTYIITYCSPNTDCDGLERLVELTVEYDGQTATDEASYVPCACPVIERTPATVALSSTAVPYLSDVLIEARVTDSHEPYVQWVSLFYRTTGTASYTEAAMTLASGDAEDGIWHYTITSVVDPGIDYYLVASDGECRVTDPSTDPSLNPYQIAVQPNYPPLIVHTPVETGCEGDDVIVSWQASDETESLVETCLYYRRFGTLVWNPICTGVPIPFPVIFMIPGAQMTEDGIEYYITATDNYGITSYHGTSDDPHFIESIVCDCPPYDPELVLTGYDEVDWSDPYWVVQVSVHNNGPGPAMGVNVTMNSDVAWLVIPDPHCSYGDIAEGATALGGCDSYTFDLTASPGGSFNVWFDVSYSDTCQNQYRVRLDPEFDPEGGSKQSPMVSYRLAQNYPNPFNPNTMISYQIPKSGHVSLNVYDVSGRLIRTLVDGHKDAGLHTASWDGKDSVGRMAASGIYFYKMVSGQFVETRKMIMLR